MTMTDTERARWFQRRRMERALAIRNRVLGVAAVPAVWGITTLPTGDSWTPHWLASTVAAVVVAVCLLAAWSYHDEAKRIEKELTT